MPASAAGVAPQANTGDSALLKQLLGELAKVNSRMDALEAQGSSKSLRLLLDDVNLP